MEISFYVTKPEQVEIIQVIEADLPEIWKWLDESGVHMAREPKGIKIEKNFSMETADKPSFNLQTKWAPFGSWLVKYNGSHKMFIIHDEHQLKEIKAKFVEGRSK